jgi:hypothetical protein
VSRYLLTALGMLGVGLVIAAACSAQSLPDWSGVWQVKGSMAVISRDDARMFARGTRDFAPLKPRYESRYQSDLVRAEHQGDPQAKDSLTDTNTLHCFAGMPRLIATPFQYEFILTPRESWILIDKAIRHIFTDDREWPAADARWPLMLGRSRGHWDGATLVIETVDMRTDMWADTTPLTFSSHASVIERIRKIDANTLENQVTIRDPEKFTRDWHFARQYVRTNNHEWPDDPELCGGPDDRNPVINGHVTVQLPSAR